MSDPPAPDKKDEEATIAEPEEDQSGDSSDEGGATGDTEMEFLRNLFSQTLGLGSGSREKVLDELSLEGVARYIQSGNCKNVICMVGAGISTSAGIPDFRSPDTGLYANLQKYNLPYPEAIFQIDYFKKHPEPFFALARELYPGQFKPTVCHYFIRMLKDKGLLRRCYSQNIDTLERVAGLQGDDLVEAHGTFYTSHCVSFLCRKEYTLDWMKEKIFADEIPKCDKCSSLVKPDIVFFGENLPARFFTSLQMDFPRCDLLIIMGTSLQVQPFASLVGKVSARTPRLLINKEKTGQSDSLMGFLGFGGGMDFDSEKAYRDVAYLGTCDDGCLALADLLGWKTELEELVKQEHTLIDSKDKREKASAANQNSGAGQKAGLGVEPRESDKPEQPMGEGSSKQD
ncbi:NAD-dependent protein deacetylase sirtuin-2 isoform X1 [Lepisosteus oculatus]|uniref:NAD-dependent protein deacetylase sirtuin-2 isoform X1 n=2 Tax=Lepisosteus oculatus TaxID=7918 RepID=UPI0007400AEC|nr:PREDICTED: NAD-dependent protein deacetylase sirtuin-2 isoform X1 [Lepisosteus oculatus]